MLKIYQPDQKEVDKDIYVNFESNGADAIRILLVDKNGIPVRAPNIGTLIEVDGKLKFYASVCPNEEYVHRDPKTATIQVIYPPNPQGGNNA